MVKVKISYVLFKLFKQIVNVFFFIQSFQNLSVASNENQYLKHKYKSSNKTASRLLLSAALIYNDI
jgi:hypothetical protein